MYTATVDEEIMGCARSVAEEIMGSDPLMQLVVILVSLTTS